MSKPMLLRILLLVLFAHLHDVVESSELAAAACAFAPATMKRLNTHPMTSSKTCVVRPLGHLTSSNFAAAYDVQQRSNTPKIGGSKSGPVQLFRKCRERLMRLSIRKPPFTSAGICAAILFMATAFLTSSSAAASSSVADLYKRQPVRENVEAAFRIIYASVLGSTLGLERSSTSKKDGESAGAGLRTMALVSLGACVFTLCGTQGFAATVAREAAKGPGASLPGIENASVDASRMASTITAGVGFIGAGVITNNRMPDGTFDQESTKRGLTTAATIWVSAAVGAAAGAGMYATGFTFVLCSLFVLGLGEWLGPMMQEDAVVVEEKQKRASDNASTAKATTPKDETTEGVIAVLEKEPSHAGLNETVVVVGPETDDQEADHPETAPSWTAVLDEPAVTGKKKEKQIYTKNETLPSGGEGQISSDVNNTAAATKAPSKSVDLYVERFIKKGGNVKGAKVAKKDESDEEEGNDDIDVDSQQVIW